MKSLMATLAAIYLKISKVNDKNFMKEFKRIESKGEVDWKMNPKLISDYISEEMYEGLKIYKVNFIKILIKFYFIFMAVIIFITQYLFI